MRSICPSLFYSALVGAIVGVIISAYNYAASWLVNVSQDIYGYTRANPMYIPLLFIGLIALALIMCIILRAAPECKGGGVPRVEGYLRGFLIFNWLRVFLGTLSATAISYFSGISLGAEGPSVLLGTSIASCANSSRKKRKTLGHQLETGGAAAGLAVAFNAPLTGIIFAVEEVHRKVSPFIVFTTACTVIVATFVSRIFSLLWGGVGAIFDLGALPDIPMRDFWMLLILGLAIGVSACLFILLLTKTDGFLDKLKNIPQWTKLIFAFVLTGALGLALPASIGGGHDLIMDIGAQKIAVGALALLFFAKLLLTTSAFNSGATGGLFVPMLCIGAIIGGFFGKFFMQIGLEPVYYTTIVAIAMTAFFGATVRAPITAVVLIVEITGQLNNFLMTALAIFTAFLVPIMLRIPPLYDSLSNKIVNKEYFREPPLYRVTTNQ